MSTVSDTLAERGARYGQFADHARIAQALQDVIRNAPNWNNLDYDMKQALVVFTDKIARILNGDPFYIDNWHDIQGYAKLVEDRLQMIPSDDDELFDEPTPAYVDQDIKPIKLEDITIKPVIRPGPGLQEHQKRQDALQSFFERLNTRGMLNPQ